MERLTEFVCGRYRLKPGYALDTLQGAKAVVGRLAAYENTGLEPEKVCGLCEMDRRAKMANLLRLEEYQALGSIDHLRELVQAEQDGRLVVLPVPVGDGKMVYGIYDMEPLSAHIVWIDCDHLDGVEIYPTGEIVVEADGWEIGESDIGKTVFLTREEAEAALEAQSGK